MHRFRSATAAATIAAAAALLLTGCSATSADSADSAADSAGAIAWGFAGSDVSVWNTQLEIMQPIIEAAGYEFLTSDPQWDITTQINDWDAWINRGDVMAMGGYPVQADSIVDVTLRASEAGIPVIGYIEEWEGTAATVVSDTYESSYKVGVYAGEWIAGQHGEDAAIDVVVFANRDIDFGIRSADGLIDGVTSVTPDVNIIELAAASRDDGYAATQSHLVASPDTTVFLGFTNDPTMGAYQALLDSGVAADDPSFFLGNLDAVDETLDYISIPGSIYRVAVTVPPVALAEANAELLLAAAGGEEVENLDVPGELVTAENAGEYYAE